MKELSGVQKQFAEENHSLVYRFLRGRHLSRDDYYDVVIFAYLDAVQRYDEQPHLQQHAFSKIAYRAMNTELKKHFKACNAEKKGGKVWSLDYKAPETDDMTFGETLEDHEDLCEAVCARLAVEQTAKPISGMAAMRLDGYNDAEIAAHYHVQQSDVRSTFAQLYNTYHTCAAA